jgi:hypothetical protein
VPLQTNDAYLRGALCPRFGSVEPLLAAPAKYVVPCPCPFFESVFELRSLITGNFKSFEDAPSPAAICSRR